MSKQSSISIWKILFLVVLILGFESKVSAENIYRYDSKDPKIGGARNVTVETTESGTMKVSGSEVSMSIKISTPNRFELQIDPEGASYQYTISGMKFDTRWGVIYEEVNIILGDGSSVPAQLPNQNGNVFVPILYRFFPDAFGSRNISIKINKHIGYTMIAGLKFKQEATINIWKDGVVEVDREGIEATDESGTTWISKKVRVEGKNAIIMVRKK